MKTVTQIEEASLSSGLETTAMGMVLNATSFNHIINSLYKNPLGAIIRELTTNALESHMVANTTRKVAIQLPTAYDQNFIIRDFGTGLDDEEVQKYLNTLFSTSKDKDNNLMGGFGLGSKSPLALVDTFNIISIKNGLKNNYSWIKEAGKLPSLVHLDDEEDRNEKTAEDDGIKIVIPLGSSTKLSQSRLQKTVEEEARRQLLGFSGKFMFVDNINEQHYADLTDITHTIIKEKLVLDLEHVSLFLRDPDTYYPTQNTMMIMIGGVNYPFSDSYNKYVQNLFQYFINANNKYVVCLKAPIGSLDLPMSREEILTTAQNEKVLEASSEEAKKDIVKHIKSLNINLDVKLVDFYAQMDKVSKLSASSGGVEFNLVISQATFDVKDVDLVNYYTLVRKSANSTFHSSRPLFLNHLFGERLPMKLLEEFTTTNAMAINTYSPTGDREKFTSGNAPPVHKKAYSYLITESPIPAGISHNLIFDFAKEKLNAKNDLIVIQMEEVLQKDFKCVFDVIKAHAGYYLTEVPEYLGILDVAAIKDYKEDLKKNRGTTRAAYIRTSLDYIPGARFANQVHPNNYNLYVSSGLLHLRIDDTKVKALEDIDGKRIPIGPEYIPAGKEVLLTKGTELPIDLQAFASKTAQLVHNSNRKVPDMFNYSTGSLYTPIKDCVVLKVTEASYASCLARLKAAKITVYTEDDPFVLKRPTIKDIPTGLIGRQIIRSAMDKFTNQLGVWSRGQESIAKSTFEAVSNILPKIISDPFYLQCCKDTLATVKHPKEIFNFYHNTYNEYEGYDSVAITAIGVSMATPLVEYVVSQADTDLNRNLYDLVGAGLKKEIFEKIITNLITVAVKGNTNEIQTQSHPTI